MKKYRNEDGILIIEGNYGKCIFCDNMNEKYGLPSLDEKSWDLCVTDLPYGIKFKSVGRSSKKHKSTKQYYNDNKNDIKNIWNNWYMQFSKFERVLFTCGYNNIRYWYLKDDFQLIIWYNPVKQGECKIAKLTKFEPILTIGFPKSIKFIKGIFKMNSDSGTIKKNDRYIHPCPKPIKVWNYLIENSKPQSVLDPFLGSGTTAEVCESLGIPWLGFELMEEYSPDIEKRIKKGISNTKQRSLW